MIIQARLHFAHLFAEAQHDAEFFLFDPEEAGKPHSTTAPSTSRATPLPPILPPGSTRRSLSWPRRSISSRSGGFGPDDCGPEPQGPLPPPPEPHGPPPPP